jgi:hypothetical protein
MRADPDTFKNAISKRDKDGRLYDPRKGLGGYYRYGPRKLVPHFYPETKKKEDDEVEVGRAKIHESVFRRIENHAHAYAPVGLPPYYDVVKDDGEIVSPDKYRIAPATQPFETGQAAARRALAQEHVWNEIWKRRIVYFATVGATLWLLIFPLISSAQRADEFTSPIRWVSDLVRFIGGFLPGSASTWIDGFCARAGRVLPARHSGHRSPVSGIADRRAHREPHGFHLAANAASAHGHSGRLDLNNRGSAKLTVRRTK